MKSIQDPIEKEIFNFLVDQRTKFTVDGVEFTKEPIIEKDIRQEKNCMARAKELARILRGC